MTLVFVSAHLVALLFVEEGCGEGEPVGPGRAHGSDQLLGLAHVFSYLTKAHDTIFKTYLHHIQRSALERKYFL